MKINGVMLRGVPLNFVYGAVCVVCLWSLCCGQEEEDAFADIILEVTSDAPGLVNAPVGFFAKVTGLRDNSSIYDYVFRVNRPYVSKWEMRNETLECSTLASFKEPGEYEMKVTVGTGSVKMMAKAVHTFKIVSQVDGELKVWQANVNPPKANVISTKTEANVSLSIHDPHDFLNGTTKLFMWSINDYTYTSSMPSVVYNFSEADDYKILLFAAYINATDPAISYSGIFQLSLIARDPISNYTVDGQTSLQHGDLLKLEISCEGSPPFSYCWHITRENVNTSSEVCVDPTMKTFCELFVIQYLKKSGNYKLVVIVDNEIDHEVRVINVNVFDSAPEPQLLPIILPLVCCCLALVIVVIGIMYYIQTRRQTLIEVADFDFQQSDTFEFRTFVERFRESLGSFCKPRKEKTYKYEIIHAQVT